MRTLLLICRHFPPSYSVGAKRPYRFVRDLADHGWKATVWTGTAPAKEWADPTPISLPEGTVIDRSLIPSWWSESKSIANYGAIKPTSGRPKGSKGVLGKLGGVFKMAVGSERLLRPRFTSHLKKLIREHSPDAILATSGPYYCLWLGVLAKEMSGLPLLLDLRDPWSLNFQQATKPKRLQTKEAALEKKFLCAADRVIFTAETTSQRYRELYPEFSHIHTITNSFDPSLRPPKTSAPRPDHLLVHFGMCYGARRLDGLLRAMAQLIDEGADSLRLLNLGQANDADVKLAQELGIADRFRVEAFVPYQEGLALLQTARAQVLLGYGSESLYIPAKLFDYFLTNRPILHIGCSDEVTRIIADTGTGLSVRPDDPAGLMKALRDLLYSKDGAPVGNRNRERLADFSSPRTAEMLAHHLDEIVAGG